MSDNGEERVSIILGQHSAAAAKRDGISTQRMHNAASMFLIAIEESNRKAEEEILARAVQPVNKEK